MKVSYEYAVEAYNTSDDSFNYQVDVFEQYEDAEKLMIESNKINSNKEIYFNILMIKYIDGVEVGTERN